VAASPRCVKALPNAVSVVLPCVPGPLLQLLPRCYLPFLPLGRWPSPSKHGSALGISPPLLLRVGERFWSCSHSFMFGPTGLFASQVAPTLTLRVSGSRDFYGRAYHGWLPAPCSGYANHPNRAIDGEGTRTPQIRQTCWLLRLLALAFWTLTCPRSCLGLFFRRSPPRSGTQQLGPV
jgi:hypothetical protein